MYVYMHTHTHTYKYVCIYIYICIHVCVFIHKCTHAYMHDRGVCVYMHMCMYVFVQCTYIHICVYLCVHVYICTHINSIFLKKYYYLLVKPQKPQCESKCFSGPHQSILYIYTRIDEVMHKDEAFVTKLLR